MKQRSAKTRRLAISLILSLVIITLLVPFNAFAAQFFTIAVAVSNPAHGTAGAVPIHAPGTAPNMPPGTPVATAGTTVRLTARPHTGYRFLLWEPISENTRIENPLSPVTTFRMPAENATVRAIFVSIGGGDGEDENGDENGGTNGGEVTGPNLEGVSDWARTDVSRAIWANLVPENLQSDYTQAITRAEFCALVVRLYENIMAHEITDRVTFDDTDDVNVEKAAAIGVVLGVADGQFNPDGLLTRDQAATMLARLTYAMGFALPDSAPDFVDNADIRPWALEAVGQMQEFGIMGGIGDGIFDPLGAYTRQQSIVTIMRMFDLFK